MSSVSPLKIPAGSVGGAAAAQLFGDDTIRGGDGNDSISGGEGKDRLWGNNGVDVIDGGNGNDRLDARDGVADTVGCGAGKDEAWADKPDKPAGCEKTHHTPAWFAADHHSPDIQLAARDVGAIARGEFTLVLGDFHGGDVSLTQARFGLRHPDPAGLMARLAPGVHRSPPRRGVVDMTARLAAQRTWRRRRLLTRRACPRGHAPRRARAPRDRARPRTWGGSRPPTRDAPVPADLRRRAAQLRPLRRRERPRAARQAGRPPRALDRARR